jgi:cyclopropane-fatty-acyl-phospholipid synthase
VAARAVRHFQHRRVFTSDLDPTDSLGRVAARPIAAVGRALYRLRDNTKRTSVRNTRAHYDLGNDFLTQFLDESMDCSCAYFERPDQALGDAQRAKLDRVCRRLAISPDDHVLEVVAGFGDPSISSSAMCFPEGSFSESGAARADRLDNASESCAAG